MQIKPIILGKTQYDYNLLYRSAKQALGYSINRTVDSKSLKKDTQKFYNSLSELLDENHTLNVCMDGLVLDHYSYTLGFVLDNETYNGLLHYRTLQIIGQETIKRNIMFAVVTGSLRNWRDAVIDGCSKSTPDGVRDLMTDVFSLLSIEGLAPMWSDYNKTTYNNSMVLVEQ